MSRVPTKWLLAYVTLAGAALAKEAGPPMVAGKPDPLLARAAGPPSGTMIPAPLPAIIFAPVALDVSHVISSSEMGDLVGSVQWDGLGTLSGSDPAGYLTVSGEGVRIAKLLTDALPGSNLRVSITESRPGSGSVTTTVPLTVSAPPPGPQARLADLITAEPALLNEAFNTPLDLYSPAHLADGITPNPNANVNARWFDFSPQIHLWHTSKPDAYHPATEANLSANFFDNGSTSGSRNLGGTGDSVLFSNPLANGLPSNLSLRKGGGLQITAKIMPSSSPFAAYYGATAGMLQWQPDIPSGSICYSVRGHVTNTPGLWPAYWIYSRSGNDAENDTMEGGWAGFPLFPSLTEGWTMYKHDTTKYPLGDPNGTPVMPDLANQNHSETVFFRPNMAEAYHTFTSCMDDKQVSDMVDGNIMTTINRPSEWTGPWSFNIYLDAVGRNPAKSGQVAADYRKFPGKLTVDFARVYRAKTHFATQPIGIPPLVSAQNAPVSSPDGSYATVSFTPNFTGETPAGVKTTWKLAGAASYPAANKSGLQGLTSPASTTPTPPGTAIRIATFQVNDAGEGRYYESDLTTKGIASTAPGNALRAPSP